MADKTYTETEAYELNREEQEQVLEARGIKPNYKWLEKTIVKKIIGSNPKEASQKKVVIPKPKKEKTIIGKVCEKCGYGMESDGASFTHIKYVCPNCKAKAAIRDD